MCHQWNSISKSRQYIVLSMKLLGGYYGRGGSFWTCMSLKLSVHLGQNNLESSLETRLTNGYGPDSSLGDKQVTDSTAIISGHIYSALETQSQFFSHCWKTFLTLRDFCVNLAIKILKHTYFKMNHNKREWTDNEVANLIQL